MLLNCQLSSDTTNRVPCRFMFKEVAAPEKPQSFGNITHCDGNCDVSPKALHRYHVALFKHNGLDTWYFVQPRCQEKQPSTSQIQDQSTATGPTCSVKTAVIRYTNLCLAILTIQTHFAVWLFHISTMKNTVQSM